jgi:hypothetical protein
MILSGDVVNGQPFLPFDDVDMYYDTERQRYVLKANGLSYANLKLQLGGYEEEEAFLREQSDNIYRALLNSSYNPKHTRIVLFKIARTVKGRKAILQALLDQVKYSYRTFKDLNEDKEAISPNAIEDLRQAGLWNKGMYTYDIDPDDIGVGY